MNFQTLICGFAVIAIGGFFAVQNASVRPAQSSVSVTDRLPATEKPISRTFRSSERSAETASNRAGVAMISKDHNGSFFAPAQAQGTRIKFLVDTGASVVALTPRDARRIGLDLDASEYIHTARTAGGDVKFASVTLDEIQIGGVRVFDVRAAVLDHDEMEHSLLGMTFLNRLSSYQFRDDSLLLRE